MAPEPLPRILVFVSLVIGLIEWVFLILMLSIMAAFGLNLLLAWSWAQAQERDISLPEILSSAAIEGGVTFIFWVLHFFPAQRYHEAPPLFFVEEARKQIPIVLIPSLHTGRGLFSLLVWRLKRYHFKSLWPFSWRSFLTSSVLLEDQLQDFLKQIIRRTQSSSIRIISFGSSRPIVSRALEDPTLAEVCKTWIAISAPETMTPPLRLLSTERSRSAYGKTSEKRKPDLLIHGTHDTVCYPEQSFGNVIKRPIEPMGHYGALFHSELVQIVLRELG